MSIHPFFDYIHILFLVGCVFWVWAIYDCATHEPSTGNDKIAWLLVIIFLNVLGAFLYFFIRRPERIRMFGR
ncbi:MAG TPA: PLD nuclease N-terminal domain-containing protein [Ktedonobacteraceae bacterium]|nr:PLD nuclease N-terminal domain-containing protein [Ktedonobacteraceae bacterium]